MKTDTNDTSVDEIDADLSATLVFELLADPRRRCLLRYLSEKVGAVELRDVVAQLLLRGEDLTRDSYERTCTSVYHVHLPKLVAADVVRHDADRDTVELRPAAEALAPYLRLAVDDDIR